MLDIFQPVAGHMRKHAAWLITCQADPVAAQQDALGTMAAPISVHPPLHHVRWAAGQCHPRSNKAIQD